MAGTKGFVPASEGELLGGFPYIYPDSRFIAYAANVVGAPTPLVDPLKNREVSEYHDASSAVRT
jgi:hypothetical protein